MTGTEKKYRWMKLDRNFFKRHDIQILEAMPNGKDYVLFYLKLLVESIDHEGALRFNDVIPYDETMLSIITRTNIDTVKAACQILTKLNLIEIMDDKTIFMTEMNKMLGEGSSNDRVKRYRENQKLLEAGRNVTVTLHETERNVTETECNGVEIELEKELEKETEIEEEKKTMDASAPSSSGKKVSIPKHKFGSFKNVLLTDDEYKRLHEDFKNADDLIEYLSTHIEMKGYKAKSHNLAIRKWVVDAVKEDEIRKQKLNGAARGSGYTPYAKGNKAPDIEVPWLESYIEESKRASEEEQRKRDEEYERQQAKPIADKIADAEKILKELTPGTGSYRSVETHLNNLRKEAGLTS